MLNLFSCTSWFGCRVVNVTAEPPLLWMCGIQGQVRWGGGLLPKRREIIQEGSFWVFPLPVISAGLPRALVFASTWPWMKRLAGLGVCFGARAFLCVSGVFGFDCLREERRQTCALQNTHPGTVCSWEHLNTLVFHFKGRNQQIHSWYQMFDCIQNAHRHTNTTDQTRRLNQEFISLCSKYKKFTCASKWMPKRCPISQYS